MSVNPANLLVFVRTINRLCACGLVKKSIEKIREQFPTLEVQVVDVDENTEAASAFKISSIPTFVSFRGGKLVARVDGVRTKEDLVEELKLSK